MLIEFSVQNYRSIEDKISLTMEATNLKEHPDHVSVQHRQSLLKSSVIYGANASGKSNLLSAFALMRRMVLNSAKNTQAGEPLNYDPFILKSDSEQQATEMEAIFLIEDVIYRYGFCYTQTEIQKEWLFRKHTKIRSREICFFERDNPDKFLVHRDFKEAKEVLTTFLRKNTLSISLFAQFNGEISKQILGFFSSTVLWNIHGYSPFSTIRFIRSGKVPLKWLGDFLNAADLQIKEIRLNEVSVESEAIKLDGKESVLLFDGNKGTKVSVELRHEYYDAETQNWRSEWFDLRSQESEGVRKLFCLAGLIYNTINTGSRLFIDEIGANLHPSLSRLIIRLFQDASINDKGAQLIVTTHDTSLLDRSLFRRDEIWFMEKTQDQASDLYSLAEYRLEKGKTRNDASYGRDYIRGKYGAIPYMHYERFVELFKGKRDEQKEETIREPERES